MADQLPASSSPSVVASDDVLFALMPSSPPVGVDLSMSQQLHTGEENIDEGESETDNDALSSLLMLAQANDGVTGEEQAPGLPSPSALIGQPVGVVRLLFQTFP